MNFIDTDSYPLFDSFLFQIGFRYSKRAYSNFNLEDPNALDFWNSINFATSNSMKQDELHPCFVK